MLQIPGEDVSIAPLHFGKKMTPLNMQRGFESEHENRRCQRIVHDEHFVRHFR